MEQQEQSFPRHYFGVADPTRMPTSSELDCDLASFKHAVLVPFIKGLPKNAKVLDAGCGSGKTIKTALAYRPDLRLYAIDISDVASFLPERVSFTRAGVEAVANVFTEDFFDAIICQHVIEHLVYPIAMMEGFTRVLKNGGTLFLETPNWSRTILPFSETFFWNDYTHIRIFTHFTLRRLCADFHFDIDLITTVSSAGMRVRDDSLQKVKQVFRKEGRSVWKFFKKVVRVGIVRVINPFLHDILIAVAVNRK